MKVLSKLLIKMQNNIERNEKSVEVANSQAIQSNEAIEVVDTKSPKVVDNSFEELNIYLLEIRNSNYYHIVMPI